MENRYREKLGNCSRVSKHGVILICQPNILSAPTATKAEVKVITDCHRSLFPASFLETQLHEPKEAVTSQLQDSWLPKKGQDKLNPTELMRGSQMTRGKPFL